MSVNAQSSNRASPMRLNPGKQRVNQPSIFCVFLWFARRDKVVGLDRMAISAGSDHQGEKKPNLTRHDEIHKCKGSKYFYVVRLVMDVWLM